MNQSDRPPDEATERHSQEQPTDVGAAVRAVPVRAERYLVAPVPAQPTAPGQAQQAIDALAEDPEIHVVRVIQPPAPDGRFTPVAVVETAPDHAALLATSQQFYVEADHPLRYGTAALPYTDPGIVPLLDGVEVVVQVDSADGGPLAGAAVHVLA